MPKRTHGGRRPGSGPKPKGKPWLRTVSGKFAPEEIERIDKQRQPNESRAACVRRLVMEIVKEQIMNRQIVVNEEVLEELIHRWTGAEINHIHESSGGIEASHKELDDEERDLRERLIVGVLINGSVVGKEQCNEEE